MCVPQSTLQNLKKRMAWSSVNRGWVEQNLCANRDMCANQQRKYRKVTPSPLTLNTPSTMQFARWMGSSSGNLT